MPPKPNPQAQRRAARAGVQTFCETKVKNMNKKFKLIFLATLATLILFSCKSDIVSTCLFEPHTKSQKYKGNVKSVKQRCYQAIDKFGKIEEGRPIDDISFENSFIVFDEYGYFQQYESYDTLGIVTKKEVGRKENGDCLSLLEIYRNDTLSWTNQYSYDVENNMLEDKRINNKNALVNVTKIKFNSKGKPIEITVYDPHGKKKSRETIEYNEDNMPTLQVSYDENDVKTDTYIYRYDKKENSCEFTNKSEKYPEYNYGTFEKYNERGDVVEYRYTSKSVSSQTTSTYEYDREGNWVKKTQIRNHKPELIVKRTIEYY